MEISKDSPDMNESGNLSLNDGHTLSDAPHANVKDELSATRHQPAADEPEIALESDIPSDGRDVLGEAMIRDLPQRRELTEPPSQPNPFKQET